MALGGLKHVGISIADRYVRRKSKDMARDFFSGTSATNIVSHLRSDEFKPAEPSDKKSSEWLLWFMIENRKEMIARLILSLRSEVEISGDVVKKKLRPLLKEVIQAEADAEIVDAINGVKDNIAQAVLRLLIEINHATAEVIGEEDCADGRASGAVHNDDSARIVDLFRRLKKAGYSRMNRVVPPESKSDVIKKAGRLFVRSLAECGIGNVG